MFPSKTGFSTSAFKTLHRAFLEVPQRSASVLQKVPSAHRLQLVPTKGPAQPRVAFVARSLTPLSGSRAYQSRSGATPFLRQLHSSSAAMEQSGDSRPKRKQPALANSDRPLKQRKPEPEAMFENNGDLSPRLEPRNGFDNSDDEDTLAMGRAISMAETKEWQATIEKVVKSAVSIHFCQTCSFDTDPAMSSEATGFVVDAEKGYILTNRHVVGAGPFWGYVIFDNHEEASYQWTSPVGRV